MCHDKIFRLPWGHHDSEVCEAALQVQAVRLQELRMLQ